MASGNPIVGVVEPGYADYATQTRILAPLNAAVYGIQWNGDRARLLEELRKIDVALVRDVPLDAEAVSVMKPNSGIVRKKLSPCPKTRP